MVLASIIAAARVPRLAGPWINRLGVRRRRARGGRRARWRRWGAHVSRHAVAYVLGGTALLLALAAPVLALRMGSPDDGTLPETGPSAVRTTSSPRASVPAATARW